MNGGFTAYRVHFLIIHAATKFIQHGIISHFVNICICLEISLNNKVVYTERERERERERESLGR